MRYIRYLTDLPFWLGFPIFLIGSLLTSFGLFWYLIGLVICLFGCWTFSKNLKENSCAESGQAIVCLPIMALFLWFINKEKLDFIVDISFGSAYVIKSALSLFIGFLGFQGFRK